MNYYLKRRILFLAFLSFCVILQAQREEKRISGHVRDAQDLPLAGVNIKVKNTPYGAISNEKGEYVLKGQWEPGVSIEFSFIGMKRKVVTYKGQTRLDVTLLDDVNNMDEVVVTAKANINEIDIRARSGVVQEVDMRRINSKPMIDMGLALQGSVPGLIIQNTGELGSTPEIRIRGNSSLRKGNTTNEPLYIMDGKVISPETFYNLNPMDQGNKGAEGCGCLCLVWNQGCQRGIGNHFPARCQRADNGYLYVGHGSHDARSSRRVYDGLSGETGTGTVAAESGDSGISLQC